MPSLDMQRSRSDRFVDMWETGSAVGKPRFTAVPLTQGQCNLNASLLIEGKVINPSAKPVTVEHCIADTSISCVA